MDDYNAFISEWNSATGRAFREVKRPLSLHGLSCLIETIEKETGLSSGAIPIFWPNTEIILERTMHGTFYLCVQPTN